MALAVHDVASESEIKGLVRRWFFSGMALVMLGVCVASFAPSLAHPAGRHAPLSLLAAAHGVVFLAWLLIFLVQSLLVANRHVAWHKRLGVASIGVLAAMVPMAYTTTMAMVRRGVDLSGDLRLSPGDDVAAQAVFPLFNIFIFSLLVIAALLYRQRPEIHKRLMLFANIELMPAPLAHFIGHSAVLAPLPGAIVMVPITMFVLAAVGRDWVVSRRVHALTWGLALLRMVSGGLEAGPIGSSAAWHGLVAWLAR